MIPTRSTESPSPLALQISRMGSTAGKVRPFMVGNICFAKNCPVQKIKSNLIHKAKLKKDFAKLKTRLDRENQQNPEGVGEPHAIEDEPSTSLEPHPDRLPLLSQTSPEPTSPLTSQFPHHPPSKYQRKPKIDPFSRASREAQRRKQEADRRREENERVEQERQRKLEERERHRKAMAAARKGGRNGQRKLGRESGVLLDRVRRIVGEST